MSYQSNSFVIKQDKVNLGAGKQLSAEVVCIEEGDITITWKDDTTSTITVPLGLALNLKQAKSTIVVSGMFLGS